MADPMPSYGITGTWIETMKRNATANGAMVGNSSKMQSSVSDILCLAEVFPMISSWKLVRLILPVCVFTCISFDTFSPLRQVQR